PVTPAATCRAPLSDALPRRRRLRRPRFRLVLPLTRRLRLERQVEIAGVLEVAIDVREADGERVSLPLVEVSDLDPAAARREHRAVGIEDRQRDTDLLVARGVVVDPHDRLCARNAKRLEGVAELEPDP